MQIKVALRCHDLALVSHEILAPSCSIQSLVKPQRQHEKHHHAAMFQAHLWIGKYSDWEEVTGRMLWSALL